MLNFQKSELDSFKISNNLELDLEKKHTDRICHRKTPECYGNGYVSYDAYSTHSSFASTLDT